MVRKGFQVPRDKGIERETSEWRDPAQWQEDSGVKSHHGENVGMEGHRGAGS